MKNLILYTITVMIWGTTWYAIEFQLGEVAIEISLIYRFAFAAVIILCLSKLMGLNLNFTLQQHFYIALLGLLNFSFNYFILYEAQNYLTSAMTSIVFSMLLLFNIFNSKLFFKKDISPKTYIGAATGIAGIVLLFWPDLMQQEQNNQTLYGALLVLGGALTASFGNMVSVRNSNKNYPVFQTSGWAMLYGTVFLVFVALVKGTPFSISLKADYLFSLAYLSVFGTVIAFYSYFQLLKNIGPEKTSYSIVLFPVVSVTISSLFENFEWTIFTVSGFLLVALGNLTMLIPDRLMQKMSNSFKRERNQELTEDCPYKSV
ncbi:MAG: DMT family transporter [Kangiellaceae bacterium]|nr:DMT family transporter [Kangiellaceae bacterium]